VVCRSVVKSFKSSLLPQNDSSSGLGILRDVNYTYPMSVVRKKRRELSVEHANELRSNQVSYTPSGPQREEEEEEEDYYRRIRRKRSRHGSAAHIIARSRSHS
jgi:hypothetical protein